MGRPLLVPARGIQALYGLGVASSTIGGGNTLGPGMHVAFQFGVVRGLDLELSTGVRFGEDGGTLAADRYARIGREALYQVGNRTIAASPTPARTPEASLAVTFAALTSPNTPTETPSTTRTHTRHGTLSTLRTCAVSLGTHCTNTPDSTRSARHAKATGTPAPNEKVVCSTRGITPRSSTPS